MYPIVSTSIFNFFGELCPTVGDPGAWLSCGKSTTTRHPVRQKSFQLGKVNFLSSTFGMNTSTIKYREWVITSRASAVGTNDGRTIYEATAVLERIDPLDEQNHSTKEQDLRRVYGVRGAFDTERAARNSAVEAAKNAIDRAS